MCIKLCAFAVLATLPAKAAVVVKEGFGDEISNEGTLKSEEKIIIQCNAFYGWKYRLARRKQAGTCSQKTRSQRTVIRITGDTNNCRRSENSPALEERQTPHGVLQYRRASGG